MNARIEAYASERSSGGVLPNAREPHKSQDAYLFLFNSHASLNPFVAVFALNHEILKENVSPMIPKPQTLCQTLRHSTPLPGCFACTYGVKPLTGVNAFGLHHSRKAGGLDSVFRV